MGSKEFEQGKRSPAWERYYRKEAVGIKEHLFAYDFAADLLRQEFPGIFDFGERKPTLVLGGFHPFCGTSEAFQRFCGSLSTDNRIVLLDQNETPLMAYRKNRLVTCERTKIEDWVYRQPEGSVDGFYLDCTTDFMPDESIKKMAGGLATCLSEKGLVWVFNYKALLPSAESLMRTLSVGIRHYVRNLSTTCMLFEEKLKPIFVCEFEVRSVFSKDLANIMILASKKSPLPETENIHYFPIYP